MMDFATFSPNHPSVEFGTLGFLPTASGAGLMSLPSTSIEAPTAALAAFHPHGIQTTYFVITGFDRFHGVEQNPSKVLVTHLAQTLVQRGILEPSQIIHCEIIPVHSEGTDDAIARIRKKVERLGPFVQVLWLHFGVSARARVMLLEQVAVNEATFTVPDELGQKLEREVIDDRDVRQRVLSTHLDLPEIVLRLQSSGHDVRLSADAGRFLCNWIYYRSLRTCEELNNKNTITEMQRQQHTSLFVHVPLFETMSLDRQVACACTIVKQIQARLSGGIS